MNELTADIRRLLLDVATDGKGTTETHLAIRAYDANAEYKPGSQPDEQVGGKWGPTYQISLGELTAKVLAILPENIERVVAWSQRVEPAPGNMIWEDHNLPGQGQWSADRDYEQRVGIYLGKNIVLVLK